MAAAQYMEGQVGWLTVEGTEIDNAVMQAGDNDYYLRRNEYGEDDVWGWTANDGHITVNVAPIDSFNRVPTNYLTNAEGDYVYDLVIVGASAYSEPDISGAAAWALADYIGEDTAF